MSWEMPVDDDNKPNHWVDFRHPANVGVLDYLRSCHPEITQQNAERNPPSLNQNYAEWGIRPDVITHLWDKLTVALPEDCRWVVYQTPVLVHPSTGVIFACITGTPSCALRLPERERGKAIQAGAKTVWTFNNAWLKGLRREHNTVLSVADWGPEWIFGEWLAEEVRWCLSAYTAVSEMQPPS